MYCATSIIFTENKIIPRHTNNADFSELLKHLLEQISNSSWNMLINWSMITDYSTEPYWKYYTWKKTATQLIFKMYPTSNLLVANNNLYLTKILHLMNIITFIRYFLKTLCLSVKKFIPFLFLSNFYTF